MQNYSENENFVFSDFQLIEKVVNGDQIAFVFLFQRYVEIIAAKAKKFVGGSLEFDDLFQEGMLALYDAACSFDRNKDTSFKTYASVCIENRMMSVKRKERGVCVSEDVITPESAVGPEELLIASENIKSLYERIRELLSEKEYSVLTLYLSGCSYDTIALELDMPRKAVDNALQRVRRKLRRAIS